MYFQDKRRIVKSRNHHEIAREIIIELVIQRAVDRSSRPTVRSGSLRLDIRLANDAAVVAILPAEISSEICTTLPDRIETLDDKLRLDLGHLHHRDKPARELRD